MAEIINLRQKRKEKGRAGKDAAAQQNRLLHGRTKQEKKLSAQEADAAKRHLDGHKRETDAE